MEAVAVSEKCADHSEESKTDVNGQFRIMGLQNDCTYDIRVKSPGNYVVSPESIRVKVEQADNRNLEFQAFKCKYKNNSISLLGLFKF